MRIQGLGVILGWTALLTVALTASAGDKPPADLPDPECRDSEARSCPPADARSAGPEVIVVPVAPSAKDGKDAFAGVKAFFSDVGHAASDAGAAVAGTVAAAGAAVAGALRSYAEILIGLRPDSMDPTVYASIATGATAVAAFGLQYGTWAALRRLSPLLGLVPGFSRIAKDELLDHERRSRIFELIKQNPGVRLGEIARGLEMPWGSTMHHLRKLRADRLITFQTVGHHKCFFVNGSGLSQQEMQAASVVQGKTVEGVATYIEQHPETTLKDLALALGISSPLAAFHVAKLEKAGLIQKVRDGRSIKIVPAARLCHPSLTATATFSGGAVPTAA